MLGQENSMSAPILSSLKLLLLPGRMLSGVVCFVACVAAGSRCDTVAADCMYLLAV